MEMGDMPFSAEAAPPVYRENAPGPVAQLNRVSDSGSEGSGFEPQRGHKKRTVSITARFFLFEIISTSHPPQWDRGRHSGASIYPSSYTPHAGSTNRRLYAKA